MSHTQQPPAAGQQHAPQQGQGQVVASAQQKGMAEGIRLVVAFQTHAKQSAPASPQSGQAQPHH